MFGLHQAIDAIYRKNMRSGNIEEATTAWEKEMFDEKKVEEVVAKGYDVDCPKCGKNNESVIG